MPMDFLCLHISGFMINVCSILLDLCMPFCKANMTAYADICHKYAASKHCPINYNFEPCLAGGQIGKDSLVVLKIVKLFSKLFASC